MIHIHISFNILSCIQLLFLHKFHDFSHKICRGRMNAANLQFFIMNQVGIEKSLSFPCQSAEKTDSSHFAGNDLGFGVHLRNGSCRNHHVCAFSIGKFPHFFHRILCKRIDPMDAGYLFHGCFSSFFHRFNHNYR